jgi:hypothetical protein
MHSHRKNTGIEWVVKFSGWGMMKQYLRFYAKALELKHHSTLFYDTYIGVQSAVKYLIDNKFT